MTRRIVALFVLACLMPASVVTSQTRDRKGQEAVRVEVSRDAWISSYPGEEDGNNGAASRLKLKGIQEYFLIDFDASPFLGKKVKRAELRLLSANQEPALRITVSTVMTDWNEGDGNGYTKGTDGCSFLWAIGGKKRWSDEGTDVTAITLGNGGSVWGFGDASPPDAQGWQRIPISPAVMQEKIDGRSFGFLVVDDVGNEYKRDGNRFEYRLSPNRFFFSRDQNRASAPYFMIWFDDQAQSVSVGQQANASTSQPNDTSLRSDGSHASQTAGLTTFAKLLQTVNDNVRKTEQNPANQNLISADVYGLDVARKSGLRTSIARGETLSWVLNVPPDQLTVNATGGLVVKTYALPKIEGVYDPAVPIARWNDDSLGFEEGHPTGTCVDVYAPKTVAPGQHPVELRFNGQVVSIPVFVWNFELPDQLSFIPQMNCYGLPGNELSYYQVCHDHRTTLNSLRYAWTGRVSPDVVPRRTPQGTWDWSAWDKKYGPLLDGTAFRESRRGPVPTEALYLPINENWPMEHEKHFRGGYWIEDAYDDEYWKEFREIAGEFAKHFASRGYHDTMFEFYLNNKVYFKQQRDGRWDACSAAWVFDEPVNTQDFWALRRFGIEFWKGVAGVEGPKFAYRLDISRPHWQRELLDGISSVEVVSGSLRRYQQRVMDRAETHGNLVYMYGSANTFDQSLLTNSAWCAETWSRGAHGVVPWQTMGTANAWKKLDPLSVIYPTDEGAVPSLRLKSFRDGQQLVEYLELFSFRTGTSARKLGELLIRECGLSGQTVQTYDDDAGSVRFAANGFERLEELRSLLGQWLHENPGEGKPLVSRIRSRVGDTSTADWEPVALED